MLVRWMQQLGNGGGAVKKKGGGKGVVVRKYREWASKSIHGLADDEMSRWAPSACLIRACLLAC